MSDFFMSLFLCLLLFVRWVYCVGFIIITITTTIYNTHCIILFCIIWRRGGRRRREKDKMYVRLICLGCGSKGISFLLDRNFCFH
jgi:hypothetical protein